MQDILRQLGDLIVGSIPTVLFFLFILAAYNFLVRRPLAKVLGDRYARTGGAMNDANLAIANAETKAKEYEDRLHAARTAIFADRQARSKRAADEREKALTDTRTKAQASITEARNAVERAGDQARREIETATEELSGQILAAILPDRRPSQGQVVQA